MEVALDEDVCLKDTNVKVKTIPTYSGQRSLMEGIKRADRQAGNGSITAQ